MVGLDQIGLDSAGAEKFVVEQVKGVGALVVLGLEGLYHFLFIGKADGELDFDGGIARGEVPGDGEALAPVGAGEVRVGGFDDVAGEGF